MLRQGWTATAAIALTSASTWEEWCADQRGCLGSEQRQQARQHENLPFSKREAARLSFVRLLDHTSRLDPAPDDNN
jgi:hypothetical protein